MKSALLLPALLVACLGLAPAPTPIAPASSSITGDYVEARTASVFAGACHYNGELVTTGNDAIMAWTITAGSWKGVPLAGVKAMAAVTSDANLKDTTLPRKAELLVDASSAEQVSAFADFLQTKLGAALGKVTAIRRGTVNFAHADRSYVVTAPHFGSLAVDALPNNECCAQPSLVWYSPLTPLEGRKVGYTQNAIYTGDTLTESWQRQGENSAFYGHFTF